MMVSLLLFLRLEPSVETLTELAKKKDIAALSKYSTGSGSEFKVLKGGAYDVGRFGWTAKDHHFEDRDYVVFTTPLTSQDTGELVFERKGDKLKYTDELDRDGLRIRHQKLRVDFDIDKKQAFFKGALDVEIAPNDKAYHLLRYSPCYHVSKLSVGGKALDYKQTGGVVMIGKLPLGKHQIDVEYDGTVNLPLYAGSINKDSVTLTNDYWYAMANRMPMTYSLQVEDFGEGWIPVGQGEPGSDVVEEKKTYKTFSMKLPAIYWSLTVLKAKKVSESIDNRELTMWSPRVAPERMALQPKLYAPIISLFDASFAKFPFTRYGALDSPSYGGGALEAYSYATYGGGLPDEDAHEPSHTWFGGILPNTYLKSFWNESFAVWCQDYYQRNVKIGNALDRQEAFSTVCMPSDSYNEAPLMKSGAAIGPVASDLGYGKGALVLNMLEQLVGTQNMVECIRDWFKGHPKGEPAEWEDFEKVVLRRMANLKLEDFFDDWFRRPGFANVDLIEGSVKAGVFHGRLRWNGEKFRMPLEIWFRNSGNGDMRRNLDTLNCDEQGRFTIPLGGFRPDRVYLDPRHRALRTGDEPTFGSFGESLRGLQTIRDKARPGYMERMQGSTTEVTDPAGKLLIGHPDTMPILKELCIKAGFGVQGDTLIYQGLTVNLNRAAAVAVINLGEGKKCAIAIGTCKMRPNPGYAYQAVVDDLGRFLKGKTGFVTNAKPLSLK